MPCDSNLQFATAETIGIPSRLRLIHGVKEVFAHLIPRTRQKSTNHTMSDDIAPVPASFTVSQILIKTTAMTPLLADDLSAKIAEALSSSSPEAVRILYLRAVKTGLGEPARMNFFVEGFRGDVDGISKHVAKAFYDWFDGLAQEEAAKVEAALAGKGKKKRSNPDEKRKQKIATALEMNEAATVEWNDW